MTTVKDQRLDELESAVSAWAKKERSLLQKQVALSKKILKGRTGHERLNQGTVLSVSALLDAEVSSFLEDGD